MSRRPRALTAATHLQFSCVQTMSTRRETTTREQVPVFCWKKDAEFTLAQTTELSGREHHIYLIHVTRLAVCEAAMLELVAIPPREAGKKATRLPKGQNGTKLVIRHKTS